MMLHESGFELDLVKCDEQKETAYVCEFESRTVESSRVERTVKVVDLAFPILWHWNSTRLDRITCPQGHVTHTFLACDMISECWHEASRGGSSRGACPAPLNPLPPSFACGEKGGYVPYTLVCDHHPDCFGGVDEDFCLFHSGQNTTKNEFICLGDSAIQCGITQEVRYSSRSSCTGCYGLFKRCYSFCCHGCVALEMI